MLQRQSKRSKLSSHEMTMEERPWAELHSDLLSIISNRLGLMDLLSFRAVCNYWRSASSQASAEIESSVPKPWFLLYGTVQCLLLNYDGWHQMEIPEMVESTCLASFVGWLLLYRKNSNSLFFFSPFSKAKIEIPPCPLISEPSELEADLYGAFSSYPTDSDCTVVVVKHEKDEKIKLWMLHRGESKWTFHEHYIDRTRTRFAGKILSVAPHKRAVHFIDESRRGLIVFECDTMKWMNYYYKPKDINYRITPNDHKGAAITLDYTVRAHDPNRLKQYFRLSKNRPCSLSICGTMVLKNDARDHVILHDFLEEDDKESNKPHRALKSVWLQPRFHQILEDQQRW